jgi:hypothetical protein
LSNKLSVKIVVEVDYELNDESVFNLKDMIDKKMDLCMRSIVYPPILPKNKKQAEIINLNYSILTEEI